MSTVHQQWQDHRKRLADAKRAEAKALAVVHRRFKSSVRAATALGPTSAEYWVLRRAFNKTIRMFDAMCRFVDRHKR